MFMSIAFDVSRAVEEHMGVAPAAIDIIGALRLGVMETAVPALRGRYETAYGLTDPIDILCGLGQGDLSSPARATLVQNVIQAAISKLVRGFRYTGGSGRVPLFVFADDAGLLTDDLASLLYNWRSKSPGWSRKSWA